MAAVVRSYSKSEIVERLWLYSTSPKIWVASRTTVEQYRSTAMSLPDIARELGVGAVIESSIRIADNRVRITVQLIDAHTDRHLWAEVYDRELSVENIFSIQQEVEVAEVFFVTSTSPCSSRLKSDGLWMTRAVPSYNPGLAHFNA